MLLAFETIVLAVPAMTSVFAPVVISPLVSVSALLTVAPAMSVRPALLVIFKL